MLVCLTSVLFFAMSPSVFAQAAQQVADEEPTGENSKDENVYEKKPTEKPTITEQQKNKTEEFELQQARSKMILKGLTVTAQKAEERVQDVPIYMTVFDEIEIEDRKIESIQDFA